MKTNLKIFVFFILFVMFVSIACGSSTSTQTVISTSIPKEAMVDVTTAEVISPTLVASVVPTLVPTLVPTETKVPMTKLGDTVEKNGVSLSAVSVENPATPSVMSEYIKVPSGYKVVAIEIIIGNISSSTPVAVNPLYAVLVDGEGFTYTAWDALGYRDGQVETIDLNTGEKIKGWVSFIVPENAVPFSIKYECPPFSGDYLVVGLTP